MVNLFALSPHMLALLLKQQGEPAYRARQILQWIHQRQVIDFMEMTNLSKPLRTYLQEETCIQTPEILSEQAATDGCYKWLMRLADGNAIETVYIPEPNRATLCVSSQVGCALNCSFCATAKEGFNRNLNFGEIIGQLWMAKKRIKVLNPAAPDVTNVVFMGMGEPLLNYEPVVAAMNVMLDDWAYGLSKYRVTLSTSGVVPMMEKLAEDSEASLAVSLHAPNNELRNQLVPLNKKYPLEVLIPACQRFFAKQPKRSVTFEYVMLEGVNDQIAHAQQLVQLVKRVPCKMNLIPFNPFPRTQYRTSPLKQVMAFQDYLNAHGVQTWIRKTRGQNIAAACGQLAGEIKDRTGRNQRWLTTGKLIPESRDCAQ